jgi:hypothetical protein
MRSYVGNVNGGHGAAGDEGPYTFTAAPRTFSALGATARLTYQASNMLLSASDHGLSQVHTVPDPYYVTNQFETTTQTKIIKFVNLPADAIIRIYSSSGILVALLEHHSDHGIIRWWLAGCTSITSSRVGLAGSDVSPS